MSEGTRRNIEAVAVLLAAFAASYYVPSEILVYAAAAVLALSVAGVFAVRAWLRRLAPRGYGARRALLVDIGFTLGMVGLVAFIVLAWELSD